MSKSVDSKKSTAPVAKGASDFAVDFLLGGVSAAISKTAAAPIERVKLLIQNQDEMIKSGRLDRRYNGIGDTFKRVVANEGKFHQSWLETTIDSKSRFRSGIAMAR